ncbi:MAG: amidohydrolase [Bacillota bacterium]|nr:amidohydrolase [Bacillota bacterium]
MSSYAVSIRRQLHMYPEIGYDLPRTLTLVRQELDAMGISYTEQYGKSSIVAVLNEEKSRFTIGIRADMDALPITEKNDVEYKSKIKGQMHACGHDVHTAILLGTIKALNSIKDSIDCRVKFIFQPAEEYEIPGAMLMANDGVMDDVDVIVACHVDAIFDVGTVAVDAGMQTANSMGFSVEMFGKSSHAAFQYRGVDAIAMCVKAYTAIELMVAKELPPKEVCVLNIGSFNGGKTNNVVADYCRMYGTLRTFNMEINSYIFKRITGISQAVAKESGGNCKVSKVKFLPSLINDEKVSQKVRLAAEKVVGKDKIFSKPCSTGGEDFSYFAQLKPGIIFRLGIKNKDKGIISAVHMDTFDVDESCIDIGINIFKQFVIDNCKGI